MRFKKRLISKDASKLSNCEFGVENIVLSPYNGLDDSRKAVISRLVLHCGVAILIDRGLAYLFLVFTTRLGGFENFLNTISFPVF